MYFLRKYKLTIDANIIEEFRINFVIDKSLVGFPNLADIKIYNLSKSAQALIKKGCVVKLEAGYDGSLKTIFSGEIVNVTHIYNKPDWITEIFAGDAHSAIMNSTINKTINKGADTKVIFGELLNAMPGVSKGFTDGIKNCITKKRSILKSIILSGSVKEWLDKIATTCGFEYTVEDGVMNAISKESAIKKEVPYLISQDNGMIEIPEQTEIGMDVSTLLNGEYKLGRVFKVESMSSKINVGNLMFRNVKKASKNSIYRINNIKHTGDSRDGEWKTKLTGQYIAN